MANYDLFSILGFEPEKEEKEEKKETKKTTKVTGTSSNLSSGKEKKKADPDAVSFPVTVIPFFSESITYQAADFSKEEVTDAEVFDKFTEEHPEYPKELFGFNKVRKNTVSVFPLVRKATIGITYPVNTGTKYQLGSTKLDLSAHMESEDCEVAAADLIASLEEMYPRFAPFKIMHSKADNILIPYMAAAKLYSSMPCPCPVHMWGKESFIITEDDLMKLRGKQDEEKEDEDADESADEDSLEDEENMEEEAGAASVPSSGIFISAKEMKKLIDEKYPEYKGTLKICTNSERTEVILLPSERTKSKSSSSQATADKTYPTNAMLSLFLHDKYPLTPEMFGGKERVTEKELKEFLEERYPEFSPERTTIIYDKAKNLIMPGLKSSSKGALPVVSSEEEEENLKLSEWRFPYIREYEDGSLYRVENTFHGEFRVCMQGDGKRNALEYKLPLIPKYFLQAAEDFFQEVYRLHQTESMLQLFFSPESHQYFFYVPYQDVSSGTVDIVRDMKLEYTNLLVADIHSHGRYPAFWSSRDNSDEKGTRIFGVMGDFHKQEHSYQYRVGCGGHFFDFSIDSLVEDTGEKECRDVLSQYLLSNIDRISI